MRPIWWVTASGGAALLLLVAALKGRTFLRLWRREALNQVAFEVARRRVQEEGDRMFSLTPEQLRQSLIQENYFLDPTNCHKLWAYLRQGKPVGLRGEPGIGKSQLPESLAKAMGLAFYDVECHSQLEADEIGVSWNGFRQIVDAQTRTATGDGNADLYTMEYLNSTPLLESLLSEQPTVVRVDEVDKLNEHTTNFFLRYLDRKELIVHNLADGKKAIKARSPLFVFLTSNEYKRLDPAFMRRICWIDLNFPPEEVMAQILQQAVGVPADFAARVARLLVQLRSLSLEKKPAISEGIEWCRALVDVGEGQITREALDVTMGFLAKYKEDEALIKEALQRWYDTFGRVA